MLISCNTSEEIVLNSKAATSGIPPTSCLSSHVNYKRLGDIFPHGHLHVRKKKNMQMHY